ncbi:KGK domain-containing protein [Nostoc sp. LEGE 12450]|uniref:KGK domain-containing protein n=1 Tax=Nostoc sp. LEGE 12450 TaxID=1828643 RepID=UPI0018817EF5|nr:KGK domain-containing protein [Nostoc sp. LEGE 12450]MBE8990643.1 hypothetical protein [Nostoc sp. LEGE 12450]
MNNECNLADNDVLAAETSLGFGTHKILKFSELKAYIKDWVARIENKGGIEAQWFKEGLVCQVLCIKGGGWQKGRLLFRMEFIPDEPEVPQINPSTVANKPQSPLADLRSHLDV